MGTETPAAVEAPPESPTPPREGPPARIENRAAAFVLGLVPGALVLYLGFNGGGFFAGTVGFACVIVIQLLIVRVLLGDHPFEGFSLGVALVGVPLAAFVGWILLSGTWSHAHDRALIEFDRGLLYLMVFLLFALVARTASRIPWIVRGLAVAILVVGAVGLFSRLRPDVLHTFTSISVSRLAYPLTYWNALGILSAIGILLFLGLAASRTEPRPVRALACGAVPILALTVYFTFSRGALLALGIGLVVYLVAARSSGLPGTVLATAPTTAIAVISAYHQGELASDTPATALGVSQGDHLLHVAIACALAAVVIRAVTLFVVDRPLARIEMTPALRRSSWIAAGGAAFCALIVALALGAPHWISQQYHGFVHGSPKNSTADLRVRFTDPSSNGRIDHWRAATQQFDAQPFHGSGAGTYEFVWNQRRQVPTTVVDAHSLYVEVMAELGIVGLLLLVATLVGIIVALAARVRGGENRVLYAALLAAVVAWAVHAGIDWDWEMPAVTAWVFAVGGAALAARAGRSRSGSAVAQRSRVPVAAALIVAAATPALLLFSQNDLSASAKAFNSLKCPRAKKQAISSIDELSIRPEPYRILGYCDIDEGRPAEAVAAMRKAVDKSPRNWQSHYGLAIALASAGQDPRPEIQRAQAMNPVATFIKSAAVAFGRSPSPAAWQKAATPQMNLGFASGTLTFK